MDEEKEKRIRKEKNKLKKIFKDISDDKKKLVENLIQNAAFMSVTLEDLQKKISTEGAIITAKNGNGFETVQENPAQKSYNTMINRYCSTIKQLQDLLPNSKEDNINKAGEALAAFVTKGKPGDIH